MPVNASRRWSHIFAALSAVLGLSASQVAQANELNLQEFTGYWSGVGVVTMANGSTEQLKCVATYKTAQQELRQNLRCASTGYSISAAVDLRLAGGAITGTWEEKTYSANGLIAGQVTNSGFTLAIKGPTFSADMSLTHSACKQAIEIAPTGVDVAKITIGLGKC
jgi:NOL1/NOP2/fmu family ribosome biogenesis protein